MIAAVSPPLSVMTLGPPRERLTAPAADTGLPFDQYQSGLFPFIEPPPLLSPSWRLPTLWHR